METQSKLGLKARIARTEKLVFDHPTMTDHDSSLLGTCSVSPVSCLVSALSVVTMEQILIWAGAGNETHHHHSIKRNLRHKAKTQQKYFTANVTEEG